MELICGVKQVVNDFQRYKVDIQLPFAIKSGNFRKSQRYERDGHWNEKQRLKYSVFLAFFKDLLEDPLRKKRTRVYDMMSDMIVTRNSNQCRSHHQKMEKYRNSIPEIINSVAEKYEPTVYRDLSQRYLVLIKSILQNADKYKRTSENTADKILMKRATISERNPHQEKEVQVEVWNAKEVEALPLLRNPSKSQVISAPPEPPEKKQLKRTSDGYEDAPMIAQSDQELPVMRLDDLSEDEEEGEAAPMHHLMMPGQIDPSMTPLQPADPFPTYNHRLPSGYYLDAGSRYHYQQQVAALELEKRWHMQNAEHLYAQWSNEMQSIKLCDDSIKIYNQMLAAPPFPPQ